MESTIKAPSYQIRQPRAAATGSVPIDERDARSLTTVWTFLKLTFGLVPVVAGLDKFTNLLVNWESYLNPVVLQMVPVSAAVFMGVVGIVEIAAGILVLARPGIGAWVVTGWLVAIALSLIAAGSYLDVAVRDLVMAIGAFSLARMTPMLLRVRSSSADDNV